MTLKHSLASKRYWKKIPKKDRSKMMSVLAKKKASKMNTEQRKELSLKMNQAKREKKNAI